MYVLLAIETDVHLVVHKLRLEFLEAILPVRVQFDGIVLIEEIVVSTKHREINGASSHRFVDVVQKKPGNVLLIYLTPASIL